MIVAANDIQPGDRIERLAGSRTVRYVYPVARDRYTTVIFTDGTVIHYRPSAEIEVDR